MNDVLQTINHNQQKMKKK